MGRRGITTEVICETGSLKSLYFPKYTPIVSIPCYFLFLVPVITGFTVPSTVPVPNTSNCFHFLLPKLFFLALFLPYRQVLPRIALVETFQRGRERTGRLQLVCFSAGHRASSCLPPTPRLCGSQSCMPPSSTLSPSSPSSALQVLHTAHGAGWVIVHTVPAVPSGSVAGSKARHCIVLCQN